MLNARYIIRLFCDAQLSGNQRDTIRLIQLIVCTNNVMVLNRVEVWLHPSFVLHSTRSVVSILQVYAVAQE